MGKLREGHSHEAKGPSGDGTRNMTLGEKASHWLSTLDPMEFMVGNGNHRSCRQARDFV